MKMMISGRHVGVTESMKEYAETKVLKLVKFFDRITSVRVTMDIEGIQQHVEMVVEVARGQRLVAKAEAVDMYAACDLAERKLAQRLRKYKDRLTDHHRGERIPPVDRTAPVARGDKKPHEETYQEVIDEMQLDD